MENQHAFPIALDDGWVQRGMTLRDYFAGQAMIRMQWNYPQVNAPQCYDIADEMMKAREQS